MTLQVEQAVGRGDASRRDHVRGRRFAGRVVMGDLYDVSIPALVAFSVAAELLAIPLIVAVHRRRGGAGRATA